jgi:hypothetical protein
MKTDQPENIILFFFFFVFISAIFTIGNFRQVLDESTKEALIGVNIIIKNTTTGTATDNNGFFRLEGRFSLPCTIQLSMIGYKTLISILRIIKRTWNFFLSNNLSLMKKLWLLPGKLK